MHHDTPYTGKSFVPAEESPRYYFLIVLFWGVEEVMPMQDTTIITVTQVGLELLDLTLSAPYKWTASCVVTCHLVDTIWGHIEFLSGYHAQMQEESW